MTIQLSLQLIVIPHMDKNTTFTCIIKISHMYYQNLLPHLHSLSNLLLLLSFVNSVLVNAAILHTIQQLLSFGSLSHSHNHFWTTNLISLLTNENTNTFHQYQHSIQIRILMKIIYSQHMIHILR